MAHPVWCSTKIWCFGKNKTKSTHCFYSDRCSLIQSLVITLNQIFPWVSLYISRLNTNFPSIHPFWKELHSEGKNFPFPKPNKSQLILCKWWNRKLCSCKFFFWSQFCLDVNAEWRYFTHKHRSFIEKQLHQSLYNSENTQRQWYFQGCSKTRNSQLLKNVHKKLMDCFKSNLKTLTTTEQARNVFLSHSCENTFINSCSEMCEQQMASHGNQWHETLIPNV